MPSDEVATSVAIANAGAFVTKLNDIILFPLIGLLSGVAFLVFLWGCAQYIMNASNPSAREQGVKHITFGIIGLLVMMSAWAILSVAAATFGLNPQLQEAKDGSVDGTSGRPGGADGTPGRPGGADGTPGRPGGADGTPRLP